MKFLKTWVIAALLSGFTSMALAVDDQSPWQPAGPVHAISVSSGAASTAEQITPTSTSFNCVNYRLENTGGTDAWVGFGETAALAETNAADIPTGGDTGVAVLVKAGTAQVLTHGANKYVSAKTASGSTTLYVGCGVGVANGVTGILLGTGTSSTSVQGPVADGAADTAANPVEVAGSDGTNIQTISVTTAGEVITAGGKVEDAGHTTGDRGTFILAVANEAQSTLAADGDYTPVGVTRKGAPIMAGVDPAGATHTVLTSTGGAISIACGLSATNAAADTQIKSAAGTLCGIFVASASGASIKIWNNTSCATTTLVNTFTVSAATWYPLPFAFSTGLCVDITGTIDYTVSYN